MDFMKSFALLGTFMVLQSSKFFKDHTITKGLPLSFIDKSMMGLMTKIKFSKNFKVKYKRYYLNNLCDPSSGKG